MKAPEAFAAAEEILWRESQNVYQPIRRPLPEFLSTIELTSNDDVSSRLADGPVLVFLEQACMANMQQHAEQDILREQAGILCGQAYLSHGRHYVAVESAIAVDTLSDAAHFRFHQNSWQDMWPHLGNSGNIVGWYHTHPAMGIFLSATDLRTQQLYFSSPWQVAVVIDPISREIGFFYGTLGAKLAEDSCLTYVRKIQG
jgi:proteasome lid subunit RPN8/RPN11